MPVDNSGTNEVAHNLESNPKEDDSLDSVNRTAHSNAQQTQERNIELACENDKGVRKELKGEGTIVDQRKNVKHFAIAGGNNETDTRAADEHLGSADLSVHPSNDIMAVSADENSCSQDIFSSPKPASRNLFEDLQKTILNRNEGDTSYSRQTSDLVSNDNLTSVSEQIKEVRNTATETNYNKDNISQYSNNVSKGINSSFGFSDCANHSSIPTEAVKGTRDNKKDKDKSKNETADYYSVKLLASTELDKTGKASSMDTVHNFTSPINSLNSSSETKSKLLKEIGEDAMEITETVVKNQKANTEAVLAVSETPTDSDWTIPSSIDLDDFVNVKSRSRTRRSSSAKRRQSLRIAELSSQESSQSNSDSLLSDLYVSSHKQKAKHTDKILEVSSIFQCLLDEANRDNTNSEFSLPPDFSEEFKSLQLVNENKISEVFMQTESNNDTEAQCIHEDIKMQESELLPSKENSTTDDAELGLNGKTDCKEEAEREQKQHFIDKCTDVNSAETTASITDRYNKITSSSSELQVQVNHAMEEDGEDNQSSENILCMSPPLFESQPDKCITDTDTDSKDADIDTDNYSSPQVTVRGMKVGSRASPAGTAVLPGDQEEAAQTVGLSLEQAHIFQVCLSRVKNLKN